jgi:glycosyltransferase involved in cell wall biosynthesis
VPDLKAAVFGRSDWPTVSVVIPARNEADDLEAAVASVLAQDYPLPFDICLAVAPSTDDTEAIAAALAANEPRVMVVSNPAGTTPAALNTAIAATAGEVVVRVDGHARLSAGYIEGAVATMCLTGAVNVGGIQAAVGGTPFEQAVATAMTSWFGTGGSRFHVGGASGPVDTVYLGVFDRPAGNAVGWFDESLVRNQDYELNIRLRHAGGIIWFDPGLSVSYRPRGSARALAKQYFEFGRWKAEVLRRHPRSLRVRQFLPAATVLVHAAGCVTAIRTGRVRNLALPGFYTIALAVAAVRTVGGISRGLRVFSAAWIMHQAWGVGVVFGFAQRRVKPKIGLQQTVRSANSSRPRC